MAAPPRPADPNWPIFHARPRAHWINDPCGPIVVDGRCHLFFQYNPFGAAWGNMHWGHLSSHDLVHWRQEPIALVQRPDGPDRDGVFTGCVVMDGPTPTALYTGIRPEVQCIATASPDLRAWTQETAPILLDHPPGMTLTGFRDPQVFADSNGGWEMVLGAGLEHGLGAVLLYRSMTLRDWTFEGVLYQTPHAVETDATCECPDLFQLGGRDVLLYSRARACVALLGERHDARFTVARVMRLSHGVGYAVKTMLDDQGRRVAWEWLTETRPETAYVAAGWAGVMSLPRVLTLTADGSVHVAPHPAIDALEGDTVERAGDVFSLPVGASATRAFRLRLHADLAQPGSVRLESDRLLFALTLAPSAEGCTLTCGDTRVTLDTQTALALDVLVDGSVVEVFTDGGLCVAERFYADTTTACRVSLRGGCTDARARMVLMTSASQPTTIAGGPG
ncbi:beta-fructosidase [Ameyamaea chiangmaiensis NBRC 103196]|nr:glycoside hydrolase family 32 protein [Ameyamaea chiangmaiensis]MBS4074949.1 glycoside hydrolase family 32 protein [Ameyamaea chiangmaiensis]GBQ63305.1 beta-fructosidase [Ameyamaea chiangmaiensis NBRC 103196]